MKKMNDNTEADVGKISPEDIPTPQHSFEIAKKCIRNACPEDEHDWAELRREDGGFYHWRECRECGIADVTAFAVGQDVDTPHIEEWNNGR